MPHPRPWSVVDSEPLQDCRVFRVRRTLARSPAGRDRNFYCIDADEWVNVVPVTPDDEIVMVRQYRHGADVVTLEIPGGIVDPGETPAVAAARELREETGYAAESVTPLGRVNPNPALFGNGCHTFLARGARPVGEIENPGDEETAVELVPRAEVPARLRSGEIDHALVVAALFFFELGPEG
ncbi:MAG: NUDIX hydrolase [Myxococcales bacterium]|nr:NUDIX hydrolase [Myxococcales bacterium]